MDNRIKLLGLGALLLALIVGAIFVVRPMLEDRTVSTVVDETVARPDLNFAFAYPAGESGYTLIEPPVSAGSIPGLEAAFIMMNTQAYLDFQAGEEGEGAPPSISIFVFAEPEAATSTAATATPTLDRLTRLRQWAEANPGLSSFDPAASIEEVELDGVKGLHYQTAGQYEQEVYLMFYRSRYYLLTGQYRDEGDPNHTAFQSVVNSLTF